MIKLSADIDGRPLLRSIIGPHQSTSLSIRVRAGVVFLGWPGQTEYAVIPDGSEVIITLDQPELK